VHWSLHTPLRLKSCAVCLEVFKWALYDPLKRKITILNQLVFVMKVCVFLRGRSLTFMHYLDELQPLKCAGHPTQKKKKNSMYFYRTSQILYGPKNK